jgi:DNA-binding SARP family transcriptional activator
MLPVLRIQLLGGFQLAYRDNALTASITARLQSLLAYLLLHADQPQSRQHLAFLLWPDTSESSARNNLRQFLHQLRQVLPEVDRFLAVDQHTVCWRATEDQSSDV